MYLYIETLKQRLDAINQLRVDRALAAMGPAFQQVYSLLPTLLHYHHPLMPGYLDGNVPKGICLYTPDETQRHYLNELELYRGMSVQDPPKGELPITGVYTMGSTSSVGQSCSSDLDIWVCHQSWLDSEERQLLQRKCSLLESWAASLGVEVSFFLIDENRFRHNVKRQPGGEDCGSTQHILLLDEFYRTAVRLAGKRILWNMVPCDEEEHYDDYVMTLYAQGVLTPNEWLDLGGLSSLSAEEYFGASLWQLYKSIDSPYKAVLKTLLLEAYSWEYPNPRLLAKDIKQRLHDGEIVSFGLDPYCMMLERVTEYLTAIEDFTRLDLVRRCFYLKVCEKLSRERACVGWRRAVLSQLVSEWGWDEARLAMLDNRANWKIDQVREAHNELLDAMMQFSKMHGLGNDFMVVDAVTQNVFFSPELIRRLADRHLGVGFDQLLVVEPPYDPELDFHYRIFNADGSEVAQCGNGARCFARFVRLKGLTNKRDIRVSTANGRMVLTVTDDDLVRVNMGEPNFEPSAVPFRANKAEKTYIMRAAEQTILCGVVSMGNPHCVIQVDDVDTAAVETLGPVLESHERFPERANIGFMQVVKREHIRLRVYERGAGETQACGSGACAAVAVGIQQGLLAEEVRVELPGGRLDIAWKGPGHPLYMTGPAVHVYDGFIHL